MTLQEEIIAGKERAKILEARIHKRAGAGKLWKPKIKTMEELHAFVRRALHDRDVAHNPLIQTVFQVLRTAGSADLKDVLELTTEYLALLDNIAIKEKVLEERKLNPHTEAQQPEYVTRLVNKGLLYPDGKRTINNLDTVACELRDNGIQVTKRLLQEYFLQPDGKPYSDSACKMAANKANTV